MGGRKKIKVRLSQQRGFTEIDWLSSRHTFSFGEYYDPANTGFRALRVINDDVIAPGRGFGMHGHRDMEIITVVLQGTLEHRDSLGNGELLRAGEVQVMSAGRGIRHSETNPSPAELVHLIQIWIEPSRAGLDPTYSQREFPLEARRNTLCRVAGPPGQNDAALPICQDASLFLGALDPGARVEHELGTGRAAWIHVARGAVLLDGKHLLCSGDACSIEDGERIEMAAEDPSQLLLFDLG